MGRNDPNHNTHAQNIKVEINKIIEYAQPTHEKSDGKAIPYKTIKPLLDSIIAYIDKSLKQPGNKSLAEAIDRLEKKAENMHEDIIRIKYNAEGTASKQGAGRSPIETWASIASRGVPLSISKLSTNTKSTAASINAPEHRAITIRINNAADTAALRGMPEPPKKIQGFVNEALAQSSNGLLNGARIMAARILRSGDVLIHAETPAQAENLRRHRREWQWSLGQKAEVLMPTYGVIIHGVPAKSVDLNKKDEMEAKLRLENQLVLEEFRISFARWLREPKGKQRDGSIIIEYETPEGANAAIYAGALHWDGCVKRTERYERACQITRCFKCYQYGHKGIQCQNQETCGKCSSTEHNTNDCEDDQPMCCLCRGKHCAWSSACSYYKKEVQRVEEAKAKLRENPYWPEATRDVTPGPSQITSREPSRTQTPATSRLTSGTSSAPSQRPTTRSPITTDTTIGEDENERTGGRKRKNTMAHNTSTETSSRREGRARSASPRREKQRDQDRARSKIRPVTRTPASVKARAAKAAPITIEIDESVEMDTEDETSNTSSISTRSQGRPTIPGTQASGRS